MDFSLIGSTPVTCGSTAPELLDLSGKCCPEVVLLVKATIERLSAGATLTVISTDPLSEIDIPLFAMRAGIVIHRQQRDGARIQFQMQLPPAKKQAS